VADHYNYIITGAGCAGSSLLMRMMEESFFHDKKILVIDQSLKTENDRTWCFWEKAAGIFEPVVAHSWQRAQFFSDKFSSTLDLSPYRYKMIRGIDLYNFVKKAARAYSNIEWRQERILSIDTGVTGAVVRTESGLAQADYVFNSILFEKPVIPAGKYFLWQHFRGWIIETPEPQFDASLATFMDFRVSQAAGTSFMYVLPTSAHTALVEYALFSQTPLSKEAYEHALRDYIASRLQIRDYTISHTETGMIPMTNISFANQEGNIIHMGTAGGQVKGSTGYAFQFIQKKAARLVKALVLTGKPFIKKKFSDDRFLYYDSVLLHVLQERKMQGAEIFATIFRKNPAERVLCFLDNETGIAQDLKIMRSMPPRVFLPAGLVELMKAL
jgi:lycopene beta-cyclase